MDLLRKWCIEVIDSNPDLWEFRRKDIKKFVVLAKDEIDARGEAADHAGWITRETGLMRVVPEGGWVNDAAGYSVVQ